MQHLRTFTILLASTVLLAITGATPQVFARDDGEILLDRVVAVVDEDPILLSDVQRALSLGLVASQPGESESERQRRVLDGLIDQALHLHEVERHDFGQLPAHEIDLQVARISAGFEDEGELQRRLDQLGLDEAGLRLLITRQLRVLVYVERRLGPRVFIKQSDLQAYYDDVLVAEMARQGVEPPPFATVQEQIRDLLHEQRLNEEIEAWTEKLRREADIDDYSDRSETELPPIVQRLE